MSDEALAKFLQDLDSRLKKKKGDKKAPSAVYRRTTANKLAHRFLITERALNVAIVAAIRKSNEVETFTREQEKELEDKLRPLIVEFILQVKRNFQDLAYTDDTTAVKEGRRNSSTRFEVKVFTEENSPSQDIFRLLQQLYSVELDDFYANAQSVIFSVTKKKDLTFKNSKGENVDFTSGNVFNLEHNQMRNSSNVEAFLNDAIVDSINKYDVLNTVESKDLDRVGAVLGINKYSYENKYTELSVFLGSGIINAAASAGERKIIRDLRNLIALELGQMDIPNLEGSDSVAESDRKVVARQVLKPYKRLKGKNVKTTFEPLKPKGKPKGEVTLDVGGKVKQGPTKSKTRVKKKAPRRRKSGSSVSLISLIPLLNRDLPEKIEQLMGTPALNYRTGRFARSVEVREITTTRQGYPSIGYTYQKNPYQTFEPGFAQGSPDRDPRTLITKAMRELMVNYAIGRFYTRRI